MLLSLLLREVNHFLDDVGRFRTPMDDFRTQMCDMEGQVCFKNFFYAHNFAHSEFEYNGKFFGASGGIFSFVMGVSVFGIGEIIFWILRLLAMAIPDIGCKSGRRNDDM